MPQLAKVTCLLFFLLSACGPTGPRSTLNAVNDSEFSGIISVSSTYTDDKTKDKITIEGRGFVVEYNNHKFIATAAHLSQGDLLDGGKVKLKTLAGQPIPFISSYGEAMMDVEFFSFDDKNLNLEPLFQCNKIKETVVGNTVYAECIFVISESYKAWFELNQNHHLVGIDLWVPRINGKPIEGFKYNRETGDNAFMAGIFQNNGTIDTSSDTLIPTQIPEGYSGSPVINRDRDGTLRLQGIVQAHDRIYNRSWIKSWSRSFLYLNYFAQGVFNKRVKQARNVADQFTWRMQYGNLYRIGKPQALDFYIGEYAFARPPSGGTRGETGGTRGETGGTRGETGNQSQPSKADRILDALNPGIAIKKPNDRFRLCYGFLSERDAYSTLLSPTIESVSVTHQNKLIMDRSITLVPLCDWRNLRVDVLNRFKRIAKHHIGNGKLDFPIHAHSFANAAARVPGRLLVEEKPDALFLTLRFENDSVEIALLNNGEIQVDDKRKRFSPLLRFQTRKGKVMKINLYELLFESPDVKLLLRKREYIFFNVMYDQRQLLFIDEQIEKQSIRELDK